jgi:hypothetical protein
MSAPEADAARTLAAEGPEPVGARRHWPGRDVRPEDLIIGLLCLLVAAVAAGE